jgi:hypothetical protein
MSLDQARLKDLLHYDPLTGVFIWKVRIGNQIKGAIAGSTDSHGHRQISIDGRKQMAHRLAWLYVYGELPTDDIDHINHVKSDNWIKNLRAVTRTVNAQNASLRKNNSSGFTGIRQRKSGKWIARIYVNCQHIFLGTFDTGNEAIVARQAANNKYGFHENHGKQL